MTCQRQADPELGGGRTGPGRAYSHWPVETQKPIQARASPAPQPLPGRPQGPPHSPPPHPHLSRDHPSTPPPLPGTIHRIRVPGPVHRGLPLQAGRPGRSAAAPPEGHASPRAAPAAPSLRRRCRSTWAGQRPRVGRSLRPEAETAARLTIFPGAACPQSSLCRRGARSGAGNPGEALGL